MTMIDREMNTEGQSSTQCPFEAITQPRSNYCEMPIVAGSHKPCEESQQIRVSWRTPPSHFWHSSVYSVYFWRHGVLVSASVIDAASLAYQSGGIIDTLAITLVCKRDKVFPAHKLLVKSLAKLIQTPSSVSPLSHHQSKYPPSRCKSTMFRLLRSTPR